MSRESIWQCCPSSRSGLPVISNGTPVLLVLVFKNKDCKIVATSFEIDKNNLSPCAVQSCCVHSPQRLNAFWLLQFLLNSSACSPSNLMAGHKCRIQCEDWNYLKHSKEEHLKRMQSQILGSARIRFVNMILAGPAFWPVLCHDSEFV